MKAIMVQSDQSLAWQEVAAPVPAENEALIDIYYTALNRADLMQRAGKYLPPPGASEILGLEMSGKIAALPKGYRGKWQVGDDVCALLPGGGYAEQAAVPVAMLMPVPEGWTLAEAAGLPEAFFTAFLNLFLEAKLENGETVLIHGGASGVGTAAIQLAVAANCKVFATAGNPEKVAFCRDLGAVAVNYRQEDFAEVIRQQGAGVDVILDMVGASYFERNLELLSTGGRLVFIATLGGTSVELDLRKLMAKRIMLKGSTLRARPLIEKVAIKEALLQRFWALLEHGQIKPIIDSSYLIEQAEVAHERMKNNLNIGKILLRVKE